MHTLVKTVIERAVIFFLLVFANCAFASWLKFGENDRMVAYYEPNKLTSSRVSAVWVLYDYKTEQVSSRSGRRYWSQKGQHEVDCNESRSRTTFFTWHSGKMGGGEVVYTGHGALPWEPNSPQSISALLASTVCLRNY